MKKNVLKKKKILVVICILPLAVHLVIYSCGYSAYDWFSQNDLMNFSLR